MRILIVGGGIGGMAAALTLCEQGHAITLIDIDPSWRVYGAGITITGPTLRAYRALGMVDEIASEGVIRQGSKVFLFDGTFLQDLDEPAIVDGKPAIGGIMRPKLHRIMQRRVQARPIAVRLGITVQHHEQAEGLVTAKFSDGTDGDFDLVIGADGINSTVRELAFPVPAAPMPTGQGCWRISTKLPEGMDCGEFYLGGRYPCGITICGREECYLWLLTPDDGTVWIEERDALPTLQSLLTEFGGNAGVIRDSITSSDWINYRPLAAVLQPTPWHNGRIVLLGDAAHATTPHLASGAGMAVESAVVLGEELAKDRPVSDSLQAYTERRFPRCKFVVDSSVAIGRAQLEGESAEEVGRMLGEAIHHLNQPY